MLTRGETLDDDAREIEVDGDYVDFDVIEDDIEPSTAPRRDFF